MRLYIISKYNYIENEYDKQMLFNDQDYYNSIKNYINGINTSILDEMKEQNKKIKKY